MTADRTPADPADDDLSPIELVEIRFDDDDDVKRWQSYVDARTDSHCADLAQWRLLWRELYGFATPSFLALAGSRVVGALSLYRIRSPFVGDMLVTSPFFGYGGLYWDEPGARQALLDRALEVAITLGVDYIELRLGTQIPSPYQLNPAFAEFDVELAATAEETFAKVISSNVRQNIRKARKANLDFRLVDDPTDCYRLLSQTLREHGTPLHAAAFFRRLPELLGPRVRFSEVWSADRLIAAGVVIRYKDSIITPYIGSLREHRSLNANYLQYWGIIEWAIGQGVTTFDMGRSPRGSTHAQFKTKWGCVERAVAYSYLVVDPRRGYQSVSEPTAVQRLATRVWQRLPLPITRAVGPHLFRYIP